MIFFEDTDSKTFLELASIIHSGHEIVMNIFLQVLEFPSILLKFIELVGC